MVNRTIFQQPFWLDAVAPGEWDVVEVKRGDKVIASMHYVLYSGNGAIRKMIMPPLTHTLGPWLAPHEAKYVNQLSQQHKVLNELIEKIPKFDIFRQSFHYSITNWLPFFWKGFNQTTRYTYLIEDLNDLDHVWGEIRQNIRTDVRKALKTLRVTSDLGLDEFLKLNKETFQRQGIEQPYPDDLVRRIDQACIKQGCRKIFFGVDAHDVIHGAIYIIWDDSSAYFLMGGADPELRNSGVTSLLLWEAIQFASTVTKSFNFEGSMMPSVERFFRAFGARQKQYFQITKINSLATRMRKDVRGWIDILRG